ncbi:MAG: DUF3307 domain-containing protein [Thalassotalea sp.]
MELLLLLLTAHFIGDFYLQPSTWVECRNTNHIKSAGLRKHILVHSLLNALVLLTTDLSFLAAIIAIVIISFSHFIIDYWKSYRVNSLRYLLADQAMHFLIVCSVWGYLANISLAQVIAFIEQLLSAKNLLIAISYIMVCKPASVVISLALKKHTKTLTTSNEDIGLITAGAWIGYIERCLAISFIFMGQFAGIGFLVATKTIFRFGDLTKNKDMKLTEYMMLGTLLSYAIALFIGWNALQIYQGMH